MSPRPSTEDALGRKAREQRERETLLLSIARRLLVEQGYLGLTMDKIAAASEYSKGTVYQHFPNKEDVIAALVIETGDERARIFERAATFRGRSRERMAAIGVAEELFVRLQPMHWESSKMIDSASIRAKTSESRQKAMLACEMRCTEIVTGIVRDAIAQGDLQLETEDTPESLTFGLWSMAFGAHMLAEMEDDLRHKGYGPIASMTQRNYRILLDGYGWHPLSSAWDYDETQERIQRELFGEELRTLAQG